MEKIHRLLAEIERATTQLSDGDQKVVERCLSNISDLIEFTIDDPLGSDSLAQITRYTSKKLGDLELSSPLTSGTSGALRALRNEVVHGKSMKRIEYSRLKKLDPVLWRTLEKSAELWEPIELGNFLMYCLRTNTPPVNIREVEPKKIVRVFRAIYNALEEQDKEQVFKELALRLFSEKRFVIALEGQLTK